MVSLHRRHVLVMGMDGVRDDELRAAHTPCLDGLASNGFLSTVRVHPKNPTISGPVWATVATGVYRDRHAVDDNDLSHNRFDRHPDFLARIRSAHPWMTTFAAAGWAPLVSTDAGGPVFATVGYRPELPPGADEDDCGIAATLDEAVIGRTARELLCADHAAVFSYVVLPDLVAHSEGVTDRYRQAIETCDAQLGVLLAAIESRPNRRLEEWTIIVVTDHGHRDEGHHGGDSDEERNAWIAAAGPGIRIESGIGVDHADIPAQILRVLEVPVQSEDPIEGVPFGERVSGRHGVPEPTA